MQVTQLSGRTGAGGRGVRPAAAATGRRLGTVVYEQIKGQLLQGTYAAGERISVERLKADFEVSKQPVMDAMRRLAAEGLVEIVAQSGCRVPVYSERDVRDFFAMFGGLEGAVAGVAATRATPEQLHELQRANDDVAALADVSDAARRAQGYRLANRHFHGVIHTMAHSPVVAEISGRMWDMSDLLISIAGTPNALAGELSGRHGDHELIIDALRRGDGDAARTAMESHIVTTAGVILAIPPDAGA